MKNLLVLAAVLVTAVGVGADKKAAAKKATTKAKAPAAAAGTEVNAATTDAAAAKGSVDASATTTNEAAASSSAAPATTDASAASSSAAPTTTTTTTETVAAPSAAKILGEIDARPSWTSKTGEFHTENSAMLGYQFDKDTSLTYYQLFNTNLMDPTGAASGLGLYAFEGFARLKVNNVSSLGSAKVNYEARVYAPTYSASRDRGQITAVRNYLKIIQDVGSFASFNLSIVPIVHAYSRAQHAGKANPIFENRVYLITTLNFTDKLSLDLPLMFHQVRGRSAGNAKNSNDWSFVLWTYPELTYSLTPNIAVGAAYYSDNLLVGDKSSLSGNFGDGLELGVTQAFIRASL